MPGPVCRVLAGLGIALVTLATASAVQAQETTKGSVPKAALEPRDTESDQSKLVGLLFPAFSGSSESDQLSTFLFKEQIRLQLNSNDSGRALGFSQSYQIDAPLADESHAGAVRLARLNGFQGVVWGAVAGYNYKNTFDGVAVFPNFSWAGAYEDFRNSAPGSLGKTDKRLEIWMINYSGNIVSAVPPSEFVPLPPYLISADLRRQLVAGELCATPSAGGSCVPINKMQPSKLVGINYQSGRVEYKAFDDTKYSVTLPSELFADQASVAYVAMFFNYARGHWSNTIKLALEVEADDASTSQMVHDALIYQAAALYRSGRDGSAPLLKAREEFPFSAAASEYTVMAALLRLKAKQITDKEFNKVVEAERRLIGDEWFDANGVPHGE